MGTKATQTKSGSEARLIGHSGGLRRMLTDYRDFNRETYARGRETFDATYAAFKTLLLGAWRKDEIALRDAEKTATGTAAE